MTCDGYDKVWQLAPGELVQLDGARGTVLRVTRGTLWMTLERDPRDIVLEAGDTFTIDRGGLTLIEAQRETTVCVRAHHVDEVRAGAARSGFFARLGTHLHPWLGAVAAAGSHRTWAPYV